MMSLFGCKPADNFVFYFLRNRISYLRVSALSRHFYLFIFYFKDAEMGGGGECF